MGHKKNKNTQRTVVVIHFQPLELYPPVMNFIRYLQEFHDTSTVEIISTHQAGSPMQLFRPQKKTLRIKRFGKIHLQQFFALRLANYLFFYIIAFCRLLVLRPSKIMFFETLSSFPVYLYAKYINKKVAVFIHYHEYVSASEYASGMKLSRFFHQKEQFFYSFAKWISHTNIERLSGFNTSSLRNSFIRSIFV